MKTTGLITTEVLFNITALDNRAECISDLLQSDPSHVLGADTRDITVTNRVLGTDNIKTKLSALSRRRRNTDMRLDVSD